MTKEVLVYSIPIALRSGNPASPLRVKSTVSNHLFFRSPRKFKLSQPFVIQRCSTQMQQLTTAATEMSDSLPQDEIVSTGLSQLRVGGGKLVNGAFGVSQKNRTGRRPPL